MKRVMLGAWMSCALGVMSLGGCAVFGGGAAEPEVSRSHLPVIGLSTAAVFVEYGSDWTDHRWQSGIDQAIWKLVQPVGRVDDAVAEPGGTAFRARARSKDEGFAAGHNAGVIAGATSARVPSSGYALADRSSTMSYADTTRSRVSGEVIGHVTTSYAARQRTGTRVYAQYSESSAVSSGREQRSVRPVLEVSVEALPEYVIPGDLAELEVTVRNLSEVLATGAALHLQLPAGARVRDIDGAKLVNEDAEGVLLSVGKVKPEAALRVALSVEVGLPISVAMAD
ncbi:hypothetical protein [Mucisphaera calidilacus]|uniref:Uncharacterized protein n=1 Tax=Mucisphaera calidilacus TaxID=2527982 RepID=A0A518C114_9BACT|nr:hypothetical protein [Mucisphaera calidilacus]QDU72908.1 hypothetical protein Pan265_27840 [Mucisphaera calidilacus]